MRCDVAIIGGGPAGSTVGALLKKYNPTLDVKIFERERFPRDHVGESLLPMVTQVLNECGVWDKVEAANFPVKLGAAYRWGKESFDKLYYFHFLPGESFTQTERPGTYTKQRTETTFQVDRSVYDKILLDHAAELGCEVFQEAKVFDILGVDDCVSSLEVQFGGREAEPRRESVEAKYFVDASGGESLLRRKFGVEIHSPTSLRNIAIWDYWQNAEWAEEIGVGGTYVHVMSLGDGWIWFIPLGPNRTSIGFVTSAEHHKKSGKSTEEAYLDAISREPHISNLTRNARREGRLEATKDWSFVASRLYGKNWFLAGDACGFADPILAAGLTLAQVGARRVAYSILELERGEADESWIREEYNRNQRRNTLNHIRFADYWYCANEHFTDLKQYCTQIAKDSGLTLDADAAFQWLGTGGFAEEISGLPFSGTYTLGSIKDFTSHFADQKSKWMVCENNVYHLDLAGAELTTAALYKGGRVLPIECWRRGDKFWPLNLFYKSVFRALSKESEIELLAERFIFEARQEGIPPSQATARTCLEALEGLVTEGWVRASYDPSKRMLDVGLSDGAAFSTSR